MKISPRVSGLRLAKTVALITLLMNFTACKKDPPKPEEMKIPVERIKTASAQSSNVEDAFCTH